MPDSFNAYHEWLSLPVELTAPTYYEILGLPEAEGDASKIAQAGDRALARVRSFRPGIHAREWSRLLDEITSAKKCLLDAEVKAEYDRCLAKGKASGDSGGRRATTEPAAERTAAKAPVNLDRLPPGMARGANDPAPAVPAATVIAVPLAEPTPAAVESLLPPSVDHLLPAGAAPTMSASIQPAGYAPAAYSHPAYAPTGMSVDPMAPVSAPGYAPAGYPPQPLTAPGYAAPSYSAPASAEALPASPFGPVGGSVSPVAVLQARRARQARRNLMAAVIAGGLLVAAGVAVLANWQAIVSQFEQPVAVIPPEDKSPDTSGGNSEPKPAEQRGEPKPPEPRPSVVPTPETKQEPAPTPEPMPPAPMPETKPGPTSSATPATKPDSTPETKPEPPPMPTKAELVALGKALAEGRKALANQNFDEADRLIAEAESQAKLPEHQAMVVRLKEVAGYVKQFRNAVDQALKSLQPGAEIKVGSSTMVVVVQVSPERLTIRRAGGNVTYAIDEIPAGLTMALADSWLDATNPVNRVIKGSYFAVAEGDEETHRAKAKKYWDEAQSGGAKINHLMPFLTDKYDLDKQAVAAGKGEQTM